MQATVPSRVLAGAVLPRSTAWTIGLVIGFALLTAAAAQVRISLPFTPVPITGQTFAVLLAGASLGSMAGGASQLLYVALGAVGLPFYADGTSGWEVVQGATGGYLIGFLAAAVLVGWLADRGFGRTWATTLIAFLAGTVERTPAVQFADLAEWLWDTLESEDAPMGFELWKRMREPKWAKVDYPEIDFQAISYYAAPKQKPKLDRRVMSPPSSWLMQLRRSSNICRSAAMSWRRRVRPETRSTPR